jgi:hypothetical protein
MSKGVLMYAHNNTEIDYFKIACANALMVQKNLRVPVTLVTDDGSLQWAKKSLDQELITTCFENIIVKPIQYFDNMRSFSDTSYTTKSLQFYNCNHWEAYELSPYDETLFIDADYLIMSDALNNCWGSDKDILINRNIFDAIGSNDPYSKFIDDFSIQQYWATVIYFKKTDIASFAFSIVKHVQENYYYYKELYGFSNGMFRNDNAFSIAMHMLNGFTHDELDDNCLPITGLLMLWDTGDIYEINGINDITVYAEKADKGTYSLARFKNQDIHIMNKWAINRHADTLIKIYKGAI